MGSRPINFEALKSMCLARKLRPVYLPALLIASRLGTSEFTVTDFDQSRSSSGYELASRLVNGGVVKEVDARNAITYFAFVGDHVSTLLEGKDAEVNEWKERCTSKKQAQMKQEDSPSVKVKEESLSVEVIHAASSGGPSDLSNIQTLQTQLADAERAQRNGIWSNGPCQKPIGQDECAFLQGAIPSELLDGWEQEWADPPATAPICNGGVRQPEGPSKKKKKKK